VPSEFLIGLVVLNVQPSMTSHRSSPPVRNVDQTGSALIPLDSATPGDTRGLIPAALVRCTDDLEPEGCVGWMAGWLDGWMETLQTLGKHRISLYTTQTQT